MQGSESVVRGASERVQSSWVAAMLQSADASNGRREGVCARATCRKVRARTPKKLSERGRQAPVKKAEGSCRARSCGPLTR